MEAGEPRYENMGGRCMGDGPRGGSGGGGGSLRGKGSRRDGRAGWPYVLFMLSWAVHRPCRGPR